jgi:hypothetical protein
MKSLSPTESYWRTFGKEARKCWRQGPGAAKTARNFTALKAHRAMRAEGKREILEQVNDIDMTKL